MCMCFVCLHNRVHDPHLAGGSTLWPHTHTERISPSRSAHKCHNLFMPLCVHLCCPLQWNLLWCSASCGRRAFCSCFSYWALVHTPVTPTYSHPSQLLSHCIVLAYLKLNCLLNGIMRTRPLPCNSHPISGNIRRKQSSKQSVFTHICFWRWFRLFCRILFIAFTPSTLGERSIKLSFNFDCAWLWPACEVDVGKVAMISECSSAACWKKKK